MRPPPPRPPRAPRPFQTRRPRTVSPCPPRPLPRPFSAASVPLPAGVTRRPPPTFGPRAAPLPRPPSTVVRGNAGSHKAKEFIVMFHPEVEKPAEMAVRCADRGSPARRGRARWCDPPDHPRVTRCALGPRGFPPRPAPRAAAFCIASPGPLLACHAHSPAPDGPWSIAPLPIPPPPPRAACKPASRAASPRPPALTARPRRAPLYPSPSWAPARPSPQRTATSSPSRSRPSASPTACRTRPSWPACWRSPGWRASTPTPSTPSRNVG
jgi:hypothetical protein